MAGLFRQPSPVPLRITPISSDRSLAAIPVAFSISMGVMAGNTALRDQLDQFIVHRQKEIRALLISYRVPLLESGDSGASGSRAGRMLGMPTRRRHDR